MGDGCAVLLTMNSMAYLRDCLCGVRSIAVCIIEPTTMSSGYIRGGMIRLTMRWMATPDLEIHHDPDVLDRMIPLEV